MTAREYEQEHVHQTSALIQQEIAFLDNQKKETKSKFDSDMLENAGQRIQGGSFEALADTMAETRQHEAELLVRYQTFASQEKRQKV
jgi:DNA helicase-2/ATP-dependent DNA helicase PcrA